MITCSIGAMVVAISESPLEDEESSFRLEEGLSEGKFCKWLVCL